MPKEAPATQLPPHLVVWGDHIDEAGEHWVRYRNQANDYLAKSGHRIPVDVLDLPRVGVNGNSHFPMMDTNSDEVFELVMTWLKEKL